MRPHQWVKNLFVLVPALFAKELFAQRHVVETLIAFVMFCMLSSAIYLINDIQDLELDRAHAEKRNRPIASGALPIKTARTTAIVLLLTILVIGPALNLTFAYYAASYVALNIAYSTLLKHIAYVDVLCIATGFELRVLAGAAAAHVQASVYLIAITFLLACFLGLGKRVHELVRYSEGATRLSLKGYSRVGTMVLFAVTGIATWAVYLVYTQDAHTKEYYNTDHLIFTAPFAMIGLVRYTQLAISKNTNESPTDAMLKDIPFVANLLIWAGVIIGLIYGSR